MVPLVLLIDDDRDIIEVNREFLAREGIAVTWATDGNSAIETLLKYSVDCIVLDVMFPDTSGFDLVPHLRKISSAPILFLTAKTDIKSRIKGLSLGDDYMAKPYDLEELSARIQVLIRRKQRDGMIINLDPLVLDDGNRKVTVDGEEILLPPLEFDILKRLCKTPNIPVSFEQIHNAAWSTPYEGNKDSIITCISNLRRKLCIAPNYWHFIDNKRKEGYTLLHPPIKRKKNEENFES